MKKPKVLYILITLFCIFAIIAGIYAQFIETNNEGENIASGTQTNTNTNENPAVSDSQTEIKARFSNLFTNTLNLGEFDTTGIQKINGNEEIVYTIVNMQQNTDKYELNMHIPAINIKSNLATTLNNSTQTTFINKANEIIADTESTVKTIYSIDYVAYVNDNILSLIIRSTLKEGSSAQRIMIQTYNYNLTSNTEESLLDLITLKMINRDDVNDKIMEVVTEANEEAQILQSMGYSETYVRDLQSSIYNIDGARVYFLGPNRELYIIYPYGNSEFTSAMDIVLFN